MTTPQPDETTAVPAHPSDLRLWWSRSERAVYRTYTDTGTVFKAVEMTAQWKLPRDVAPLVVPVDGVGAATPADPGAELADTLRRLELVTAALDRTRVAAVDVLDALDLIGELGEDDAVVGRLRNALSSPAPVPGAPRERQGEPRVCTCTPTMRAEQRHCEGCIAEDVEWVSHDDAVCCDELNPDTGYRCRRTPVHDAGKSIRKHVQIDKLGQVGWWITPARALLSGGEQT